MDGTRPFIIYMDACKDGLGAHLTQWGEDNKERAISYQSKGTNTHEKNYAPLNLELTVITFGLKKFRSYVLGTRFHLYTDHQPLIPMIKAKEMPIGQIGRHLVKIMEFNKMEIHYKPGKTNVVADALSRIPTLTNYKQEWTE